MRIEVCCAMSVPRTGGNSRVSRPAARRLNLSTERRVFAEPGAGLRRLRHSLPSYHLLSFLQRIVRVFVDGRMKTFSSLMQDLQVM